MKTMTTHITMHKRYLLWLSLLCSITLLPAIALNWILLKNEGNVEAMSFAASDWQQQTHGITYSPTLGSNGFFKTLRLNDRLPEINSVVLGASTAFTIDSSMLPARWVLYNFSQSGSPLSASIAQAEYLSIHAPHIEHYIIMLDWALDFIYLPGEITPVNLARADRNAVSKSTIHSPLETLKEAISYPRTVKLWQVLNSVAHSTHPQTAFREYFFQVSSDEYTCPDGKSLGMDVGVYNRGACNGFRYDGSATFSDYLRVDNGKRMIVDALASNSMYSRALQHTHGLPDHQLLERLARLNTQLEARGGKLILLMPPLIPGMEQAFLEHQPSSGYLQRTKRELTSWAEQQKVTLGDFGSSEKFGCTADEFIDSHHAVKSCYQKIFTDFWQNARHPDDTPLLHGNPP